MDVSEDVAATLRSQEHGHSPLVVGSQPELFENYGIDSRYTGPHKVAPTMAMPKSAAPSHLWRFFYIQNQLRKEECPMAKQSKTNAPAQEDVRIQDFLDMVIAEEIGRAVQQECRDRYRMPSSA